MTLVHPCAPVRETSWDNLAMIQDVAALTARAFASSMFIGITGSLGGFREADATDPAIGR